MFKPLLAVIAAVFLLGACAEPPKAASAPSQPVRTFMLFFDFDKAVLTPQALTIVKEAANAAKAGQNARVACTGHTDSAGAADYNLALSLRRATAVKDVLVREGVPEASITVVGRGEETLLVATSDGVREPQNRRVEIAVK
jgi:OOP family OmpA-OmpF porin